LRISLPQSAHRIAEGYGVCVSLVISTRSLGSLLGKALDLITSLRARHTSSGRFYHFRKRS
jgi:hypothetical protein